MNRPMCILIQIKINKQREKKKRDRKLASTLEDFSRTNYSRRKNGRLFNCKYKFLFAEIFSLHPFTHVEKLGERGGGGRGVKFVLKTK